MNHSAALFLLLQSIQTRGGGGGGGALKKCHLKKKGLDNAKKLLSVTLKKT